MKKWTVTVAKKVIRSVAIVVEAETKAKAKTQALLEMERRDSDLEWSDGDREDVWTEDVEEVK